MDEFVALRSLIEGKCFHVALGGARTAEDVLAALGVDLTALGRGAVEFARLFGTDPSLEQAGTAFAFAFALGHAAGIRRAAMAASAPEARGREAELFGLVLKGLSIDAAHARLAASRHDQHDVEQERGNVIALRPARSGVGE
jgi:hypothetical protein